MIRRYLSPLVLIISILATRPVFSDSGTMNILVYPFKNTGDKKYSWIAAGMTDTVISDLNTLTGVHVISDRDRRRVARELELGMTGLLREETIVKAGKMTGANIIFTGSYLIWDNRIRVHAKLITVETGEIFRSTKLDGTLEKIFELQDSITISLMTEAEKIHIADVKPVVFGGKDRERISRRSKPSFTAFRWYSRGLEVHETNPQKALQYYLEALRISPDYFDALNRTGWIYYDISQHQKSIGYYRRAEEVLRKQRLQDSNNFATVMNGLGAVYQLQGAFDKSLQHYFRAEEIMENLKMQQTTDYAATTGNIGMVYRLRGDYQRALQYYFKALAIYEKLNLQDTIEAASVLNNIGMAYKMMKKNDTALTYFFRAKKIEERSGHQNTKHFATVLNNIATAYDDKGEPDTAFPYYQQNMKIMKELGLTKTYEYAATMNNVSSYYHSRGDQQKAMEYALLSKNIMEGLNLQNTSEYAITLWWIGIYHHKLKRSCQGIPYIEKAIRILRSNRYPGINAARKYLEILKRACGR